MAYNILIVDDVSMNRKILKNILIKAIENVAIIEAADGFEALDILNNQKITLVILDIMMPLKDGIEVLEEMKALPNLLDIPVLICSAIHEISSVEKALSLGALDYFTKPLTQEQMRVTIPLKVKNAIKYYKQRQEIIELNDHMKKELQLARQLQKSLILEHEVYEGIEIWGKYIPCEDIGGDFFSIVKKGNKLWFMIADILGHGVPAAMVSTMMKVIFNNSLRVSISPDQVLKNINDTIFQMLNGASNGITSAFVGCIEDNVLTIANAGHPYPILVRMNEGVVENIKANGLLIGVFEEAAYENLVYKLDRGDCIILYTDGIFDKGKPEGYANWNIVMEYCDKNIHKIAGNYKQFLEDMAEHFINLENINFVDDVAVMLINKQ